MKISKLAKRMIFTILAISAVCILGSVIFYRSAAFLTFMFGVLLGAAASIVKVFLLERAIDRALNMESKRAGYYVGLQQIIRLVISGAVLLAGALLPAVFNLWGVAAGILAYQAAVYNVKFTDKRKG